MLLPCSQFDTFACICWLSVLSTYLVYFGILFCLYLFTYLLMFIVYIYVNYRSIY